MSNSRITPELQLSIYALWGKKASNGDPRWLPLITHLADTAEIGKLLWDEWLCEGAKQNIANNCFYATTLNVEEKLQRVRALFFFLCASHDLGKATPAFQAKKSHITWELPDEAAARQAAASNMDARYNKRLSDAGFELPKAKEWSAGIIPHALASQTIARLHGIHTNIAAILGAHHGQAQQDDCDSILYPRDFYTSETAKSAWFNAWQALLDKAFRTSACFKSAEELPIPNLNAAFLLDGLLIMADWIASNEALCPYIPFDLQPEQILDIDSSKRAREAWDNANFPHIWQQMPTLHIFRDRFGFDTPNAVQIKMERISSTIDNPGIIVLEAPMGIGKTEAALAAAEILAEKSGRSGVFFALPTQATSNGIFPRMEEWVRKLNDGRHSIKLFHGKAQFNKDNIKLENSMNIGDSDEDAVYIHDWCSGRKKAMLADFVVGTIDQVLLAALRQKHVMMRHLGLANKVVIIDECHAYDAYMGVYLQRVLQWLGAYQVPVIILSATLPKETRKKLIDAYLNKKSKSLETVPDWMRQEHGEPERERWAECTDYPLITYTNGLTIEQSAIQLNASKCTITMNSVDEASLITLLEDRLSDGGCAGIIVNTVARAQQIARRCAEVFGENSIRLLHAGFLMPDRSRIETEITELLGKPKIGRIRPQKLIVVGTQVLEQSLDIDFDIMMTDWCPMDLLLQRMGRLHRHLRNHRPSKVNHPVCYILNGKQPDFDKGTKDIYGDYLLMRTRAFLHEVIHIPDDISTLVQNVYDENIALGQVPENYLNALKQYQECIKKKEDNAEKFCLNQPENQKRKKRSKSSRLSAGRSMAGCFDKPTSNSEQGEATVRDIQQESIEVILLHIKDGMLCLFDDNDTLVPRNQTPDDELAMQMAQNTVKLPSKMCYYDDKAVKVVRKLEEIALAPNSDYKPFQKSKWLKGSLFLIFDENNHAELLNYSLTYSHEYGLECYDKDDVDV